MHANFLRERVVFEALQPLQFGEDYMFTESWSIKQRYEVGRSAEKTNNARGSPYSFLSTVAGLNDTNYSPKWQRMPLILPKWQNGHFGTQFGNMASKKTYLHQLEIRFTTINNK